MNDSLVTVIIPVYNNEKYLHKCINSILNQTYTNIQVILVDDGSTDRSLEILKSIDDKRVEAYSKTNGGASTARNYGLRFSKGEYVLFVDSDDYIKENAIESLINKAKSNNADCVYYEAENYTEDGALKIKKNGLKQAIQYPISSGNELIKELLEHQNYHAVPFLYFAKKEIYDKGLRFEEGIMFEDELFSFQLLRMCKKVVCLKEMLYYRNVHQNSVMTSVGKELFRFHSITIVFQKIYESYAENKDDLVYNMYIARISMLWLDYYYHLSKSEKHKVSEKSKEVKSSIIVNGGFGNKELIIRCHSDKLWYLYIAPGRILKKIKRKLKHG